MSAKPKFLRLPIYSIAHYKNYYYFSGGGGGRTGIPNEILIYDSINNIKPNIKPINSLETGSKICENMVVHESRNLLICSENQQIIVYSIEQKGKSLKRLTDFQADFSPKNATINAISISGNGSLLSVGGDDCIVKFYNIKNIDNIEQYHQYQGHKDPIRNIHNNQKQLFLSTDKFQVIIANLRTKNIVRSIYCDQLQPHQSMIQSAYFQDHQAKSVFLVHYLARKKTYISKEDPNDLERLESMQISDDQSCQTYYNLDRNLLGVSCGNGSTFMLNPSNFKKYGHQKKHNYIITGNVIQNNSGAYITGTPQCSFNIQNRNYGFMLLIISIVTTFAVIFLLSLNLEGEQL